MISLLRTLIRPYRANLFFILCAMLVQTLMSLAPLASQDRSG